MSYQQIHSDQSDDIFIEPEEQDTRPRYRGALVAIAALLLIGGVAGGVWFAYQQGLRHASVANAAGDVPLIRADERPTRVKPDNPGGMEIPDRDKLIYTQKRAAVEHLLPLPEKPMLRPTAPQSSAVQPAAAMMQPPPAAPQAGAVQPPVSDGPDARAAAPPNTPPTAPQQPAAKSAGRNPPAISPRTAAQETRAHSGGARMQLGSLRSEEAARQEWDRVRRANSDLLGDLSATPVRADLGERGIYYRIQTGQTAEADRICAELRHRNVGCIIAR